MRAEQFILMLLGAGPDECVEWPYAKSDGYGRVKVAGRDHKTHRLAWELHHDARIPAGLVVMHSCDNPPCFNPHHLTVGTKADNRADCIAKDRHARGQRASRPKLTVEDVRSIRATPGRLRDVAERFGVHIVTVSDIRRRVTWRWLP